MIPGNQQNRKQRVNLQCAGCGMELTEPATEGYTRGNQTYCCRGCAEGTGCTCELARASGRKTGNRPGHAGERNPEVSVHDLNFNPEVKSTGEAIDKREIPVPKKSRNAPGTLGNP